MPDTLRIQRQTPVPAPPVKPPASDRPRPVPAEPVQTSAAAHSFATIGILAPASSSNNTGGVPDAVIEHLKLREGWRDHVYLDTRNLPTAGLGHLLTASEKAKYAVGDAVPKDVLDGWAKADAATAYNAAVAQAATLGVTDQSFINALASVNFQLGSGWNKVHKKTWSYMAAGEWEKAANEAAASTWNKQTPVRVQDFQTALRAMKTTPKTSTTKPAHVNSIVANVYDAMFGGFSLGTDEERVYEHLAKLNHDPARIAQFRRNYFLAFRSNVLADIQSEFSGAELVKALGYLQEPEKAAKEKKLAATGGVPLYKQGDERWTNTILGSKLTIGAKGCAVTSMAMVVSAISGITLTPAEMDAYLDKNGGYSGDLVVWDKAAQAGGLHATKNKFSIALLDASLDAKRPCVISVNWDGHWVAVTEKRTDGNRTFYKIHDPGPGVAAEMELSGDELVGAKGGYSKKSGSWLILVK